METIRITGQRIYRLYVPHVIARKRERNALSKFVRIFEFFKLLIHSRGSFAGEPFHLLDWQKDWLAKLFGTMKDNKRQYNQSFLTIGKGNGKSSFSAAIALYMLLADGEQNAQVAIAAGDRSQASIIFDECERLVKASPKLRDVCVCTPSRKQIRYPKKDGLLMALSSESATKHGLDLSCLIFDEFHTQPNRELYDTLRWATSKDRKQALTLFLTTAGFDKSSICYDVYQYAKAVQTKTIKDETFLPVIYEAEVEDGIDNVHTWQKANPSLGILINKDQFARDLEAAKTSQGSLSAFKRYRLNIWTSSETGFVDLDKFDFCRGEFPTFPKDTPAFLACDLSATTDICSLAAIVPFEEKYYWLNYSWVSEEGVRKREKSNLIRYQTFTSEGSLNVVPGNAVEHSLVKSKIEELSQKFRVMSITFDKWNSLYLAEALGKQGMEVFSFPQSPSYYSNPTKKTEALILDGKLVHNGSSLLKWQMGNVAIENDGQYLKPSKKKSTDKIDSICALIMAVGAACSSPPVSTSVYETQGITFIEPEPYIPTWQNEAQRFGGITLR